MRFSHDYGRRWPLWGPGGEDYSLEPSDLGLSPELTDLLSRCGDLFARFDPHAGWPDEAERVAYAEGMQQACRRLRAELWGRFDVEDDHAWCLEERGR